MNHPDRMRASPMQPRAIARATRAVFVGAWTTLGLAALGAPTLWTLPVRIVYNASDSMARGWYLVGPSASPTVGSVVLLRLPADAAALAAQRSYVPVGVPLLKRVVAVAPQSVCVSGHALRIDGAPVDVVRLFDGRQRALPSWSECRRLKEGEVFVLGDARALSFDSRYFGPVLASALLGSARPLWTWGRPS